MWLALLAASALALFPANAAAQHAEHTTAEVAAPNPEVPQVGQDQSHLDQVPPPPIIRPLDIPKPPAPPAIPQTPPPPGAGSGPASAADAVWGKEAMRRSREDLRNNHGSQSYAVLRADRLEYHAGEGRDGYLWDVDAWYGGDIDKLWLKTEGEGAFSERIEQAEVQALWSHAIGPWFDVQTGIRQDLAGPDRTHAVLGLQGLAPYLFEIDAALFLSHQGELTARIEAEIDQRITQRLILQPRGEVSLSAQDIPALGVGGGLRSVEAGLRLRYEIAREFAPYVGIAQEWRLGGTAEYARQDGEAPSVTSFVMGVRFWF